MKKLIDILQQKQTEWMKPILRKEQFYKHVDDFIKNITNLLEPLINEKLIISIENINNCTIITFYNKEKIKLYPFFYENDCKNIGCIEMELYRDITKIRLVLIKNIKHNYEWNMSEVYRQGQTKHTYSKLNEKVFEERLIELLKYI